MTEKVGQLKLQTQMALPPSGVRLAAVERDTLVSFWLGDVLSTDFSELFGDRLIGPPADDYEDAIGTYIERAADGWHIVMLHAQNSCVIRVADVYDIDDAR